MEDVKKWISDNAIFGNRDGNGSGYGDGYGNGNGSGNGYGSGSGCGDGSGDGKGYGNGYGYGSGDGRGSGRGYGIKEIEGKQVYTIDGIQTIITHIKESYAKGFIIKKDFTLMPCYVAKGNGYFAHGNTLKEANAALRSKILTNLDIEETIKHFIEKFEKGKTYPGTEFFEWHHYLTGSCLMGREAFVKSNDLNLDDRFTVEEFIKICENDYGSEIIKKLKTIWEKKE